LFSIPHHASEHASIGNRFIRLDFAKRVVECDGVTGLFKSETILALRIPSPMMGTVMLWRTLFAYVDLAWLGPSGPRHVGFRPRSSRPRLNARGYRRTLVYR
jgi:hypothetical protein